MWNMKWAQIRSISMSKDVKRNRQITKESNMTGYGNKPDTVNQIKINNGEYYF